MVKVYTYTTTFVYVQKNGQAIANITKTWTKKGRLLLYDLQKNNENMPSILKEEG
ncbi:hypothetical protein ACJBUA_12110 [Streptococcus suis]